MQIPTHIKSSKKLNWNQKALLSHIMGWQRRNKSCRQSNLTVARELGISIDALRKIITGLNKTSFFKSKEVSIKNDI